MCGARVKLKLNQFYSTTYGERLDIKSFHCKIIKLIYNHNIYAM